MHAIRYNEHKLGVIGSLLLSNNVDEGGPLLQVLDMLEDVDILRLPILVVLCEGYCNDTWHAITKRKNRYYSWLVE